MAGITFLGVVDATGRMDASPVSAPPPTDPLDPRTDAVAMLPHNSGEQLDLAGKLMIPIGRQQTLRLFGLYGEQQGLLYDQLFKYELGFAPAQRITGGLVTADLQHASLPGARTPLIARPPRGVVREGLPSRGAGQPARLRVRGLHRGDVPLQG